MLFRVNRRGARNVMAHYPLLEQVPQHNEDQAAKYRVTNDGLVWDHHEHLINMVPCQVAK
ncbi:hypothetical protein KDK_02280 [Dictyobacter kobayashii]|uniref:Uncharacterized protein n=1 Tax=Dictyobacter kobayashii TaxID=2014872 RepID=A0A402ABF1_9CHLR|nr:hypothetical protein KDK_02280 [Dictyobacter kobayashii]